MKEFAAMQGFAVCGGGPDVSGAVRTAMKLLICWCSRRELQHPESSLSRGGVPPDDPGSRLH